MTYREAERIFIHSLTSVCDQQEAISLAWLSISHTFKLDRITYLSLKDTEIPANRYESLFQILEELKTGKPLQYVVGETEFYGLNFKVNPSVLIPRPETEELVDWIISELRISKNALNGIRILDIGTGSGCIPIAINKNIPEALLYAMDISHEALIISRENAVLNQTTINFIEDDILKPAFSGLNNEKFQIIVSNPPYVMETEKQQMLPNVLEFEPHLALFVPNNDPLKFYIAIADFAKKHLDTNGLLYLEINESLANETINLLEEKGFRTIKLRQDLRGKDRMIQCKYI